MKNYYPVIIRKFKDGPVNVSLEAPEEFPEKPQNITFPVGSWEMTTCWFDTRKEAWEYLIEQNKIRNLIKNQKLFKYYLNARPAVPGAVPGNFAKIDENDPGGRYGAIYYDCKLSDKQITDFELKPAEK